MVSFKHLLFLGLSFSQTTPKRIKTGEGRVQFDFVCTISDQTCGQVKNVLIAAGESLDNVIEIKKPIVISVKYYDFCDGNTTCQSSIVGSTHASEMQLGSKYNDYNYPQALVKQLSPREIKSGSYGLYDMEISLNARMKFQMVGKVKHASNEISLLDTVSHEMLHGLGFIAPFMPLSSEQNLILPISKFNRKGCIKFTQSIFGSRLYIQKTNTPLSFFIDKLNTPSSNITNQTAFLKPPYIETIKELSTNLTTDGSIYFLTTNDNRVIMETGYKNYQSGSSIVHLDGAYWNTNESIMIANAMHGKGKESLARYIGWYTAPYGPITLEILATLGYTMKKPTWGHSSGGFIQLVRQDYENARKKRQAEHLRQHNL
ncbi:hypothetical protein DSO57_1027810 [Entomophthora muscae]|uniref:Uncharacterized protein n=2 Tax=Entomophthora muscae TaxID=34485 RepID=A0ACC2SNL4_9FUNG|nr:hypothetical protein DSO57_1037523 [Entomophthora muscae]KAJ9072411.1 hypothetical protein DSO57_1027810 [Entomophthora muscae]